MFKQKFLLSLFLKFFVLFLVKLKSIISVTLPLINIAPGLFSIGISIGYPEHNFYLLLDTLVNYTWVRGTNCTFCSYLENVYDEKTSISSVFSDNKRVKISDIRGEVSGIIGYDDLKIGDLYASKLSILVVDEDEFLELADGVINFGFYNSNSNNDLLYKLYLNKQIKQKIFSINIKDELSSYLTLGEIPKYMIKDKENYSVCKIKEKNNTNWNCLLSHILFGDDYNFYDAIPLENTIVSFATGLTNLYVPESYLNLFLDNYFKNLPGYSNKNCIIKRSPQVKNIYCLKSFLLGIEGMSIHFIFNGWAFKLPYEELFEDVFSDAYSKYKVFKVDFHEELENQWYFGTVFMKQHEMVFDGEKKQIGFYSNMRYDFSSLTNENVEEKCHYNTMTLVNLAIIMFFPQIYNLWKKKYNVNKLVDMSRNAYNQV